MTSTVYELVLPRLAWRRVRVLSFEATERLSEGYVFDLRVLLDQPQREVARVLRGESATFITHLGKQPRFVHGIINEVRFEHVVPFGDGARAEVSLRLVPRLWLLTRRRRSRVFTGMSLREVVQRVLAQAGIPSLWQLEHEPPKRDYLTQYEETDEELVRRLTAEAGIFFSFLQPPIPAAGDFGDVHDLDAVLDELGDVLAIARDVASSVSGGLTAGMGGVQEVPVFSDGTTGYFAMGVVPDGIEVLVQQSLAQLTKLAADALPGASSVIETVGSLGAEALSAVIPSEHLPFRPDTDALREDTEHGRVISLKVRDAIRADHAVFRTYDPRRPLALLEARDPPLLGRGEGDLETLAGVAGGSLEALDASDAVGALRTVGGRLLGALGEGAFELYEHHDPFALPEWDYLESEAKRILRAEQRDERLAEGSSDCDLLAPGARFHLDGHPADWANREYATVEVHHRGHAHAGLGPEQDVPVYRNTFWAVPANVPFVPIRPPRRSVQTCLTATVIGTSEDADLMTQGMAEVKVRFHWDREQRGTCWLRCMQSWSGAGFGTQYMPRVGMEVVVGFDGGDPDRPIVLGCVYNGTHPTPFPLPLSQTRSGIRTQTTPGGEGFNELSFEDRRGQEQIFVHAQRNLDLEVDHDRTGKIQHDDTLEVDHDQTITVAGRQRERVESGQHLQVRQERRVEVDGAHEIVTRGDLTESVTGTASERVNGAADRAVGGSSRERVGGDSVLQVSGNRVELIGQQEAPKSRSIRVEGKSHLSAMATQEIDSDDEIVLRVGPSSIRITKERIEISADEIILGAKDATQKMTEGNITLLADSTLAGIAQKVVLESDGGSLGLTSEASLQGSRVLLNSPESASDAVEHETPEPTLIELTDQDGQPLAYERYRIDLEDGSSVCGVLDADGKARVFLDQAGEVTFPDLPDVEPS